MSVVIPLFNEQSTLDELHRRLTATLGKLDLTYEIVFVDDGSTDGTYFGLRAIGASDRSIRVVKLARNYGQTAALAAGFDNARGEIIVAMDGDLQHAPEELPRLLDKLDEGYDVVSGWRQRRLDNYWTRRLPSQVANWLIAKCSGVKLTRFRYDIQAYLQSVIKQIGLYGDLHRFIPALASAQGARIAEVPITDAKRSQNRSHYGLSRTWRVMADLITVRFLLRYSTRPLHIFAPIGLTSLAFGLAGGLYVLMAKIISRRSGISCSRPAASPQRSPHSVRNRAPRPRSVGGAPDPDLFRRPKTTNIYGGAGGGAVSHVRQRSRARKATP